MKESPLALRVQMGVLVVIGMLLVPTIALGARLLIGWQSAAVVVKKIGPLPTISWVLTQDDWNTDDFPAYIAVEPLPVPAVSLGGAAVDEVALISTITIPQSVIDGFAEVLEGAGEYAACGVLISWATEDAEIFGDLYPYGGELFYLGVDSERLASDLAGTRTVTTVTPPGSGAAGLLSQAMVVGVRVGCGGDSGPLQPDLGDDPITLTLSLRVLGY